MGQGRVPGAGMESRLRGWMSFCKHLADERGRHADPQNLARAVIGRRDPCASGYPSYRLATSASKEPCPVPVERSTVHTRFQNFAAAHDLVPLADCSRNITAVQTVLCMALYLMSISAKSKAHTYIGIAGNAA